MRNPVSVIAIMLGPALTILSASAMADDQQGPTVVSEQDWAFVLDRFVDLEGRVDYAGLAASREHLDRFVDQVARVSPLSHPHLFADREAALAYYIDAYNALVFAGVLDLRPGVTSVWGASRTGLGFFVRRKVVIGGRTTSLKKLEDVEIREAFGDPRIHAALNCASVGCPLLPRVPFGGHALDPALDAAMRAFVSSPLGCQVDDAARTVTLSKIFDWFAKDFLAFERSQGNAKPRVIDYINRYRPADEPIPRDFRVRFAKYDKRLNRQP